MDGLSAVSRIVGLLKKMVPASPVLSLTRRSTEPDMTSIDLSVLNASKRAAAKRRQTRQTPVALR
jgi:hypothetical protein